MNIITVDITVLIFLPLIDFVLELLYYYSYFSHSGAFVVEFGNDHDLFLGSFLARVKSFLRPQYTLRIAAEVMGLWHEADGRCFVDVVTEESFLAPHMGWSVSFDTFAVWQF